MGGYKVQGRTPETAKKILNDAKAVEQAGAFAVVLEGVPSDLASKITGELKIPTIGIGAGPRCDGQVLVTHDALGFYEKVPKFVKKYASLRESILSAVKTYKKEVEEREYPTEKYSY